jgi:hypothetical protein
MLDDRKKQSIRQDESLMRRVLEEHKAELHGNRCRCPFHDDQHASAGVFRGKDGGMRFGCRVCNLALDVFGLRAKLEGRTDADVLREMLGGNHPKPPEPAKPIFSTMEALLESIRHRVAGVFRYLLADGSLYMATLRVEPDGGTKYFQGMRPVDGGFVMELPKRPPLWPLYGLPEVLSARSVVVVEGEAKVAALAEHGFIGTCSACGAGSAPLTDWSALAGKVVTIWPDADEKGQEYAKTVTTILEGLEPAPTIFTIDPAVIGMGPKEDVVDLVRARQEAGAGREEILRALVDVLDTAKPKSAIAELDQRHTAILDGSYKCIDWPWPVLSDATRALLPGSITVLAGTVGASKSLMVLQAMLHWLQEGINVTLFAMERRMPDHLQRALAQLAGSANHTRDEWVAAHPEEVTRDKELHRAELERFANHLRTTESLGAETLDQIAGWIEAEAKRGVRIVMVDPVTAATRVGRPWEADQRFLRAVEKTANTHGASILLVSHPAKGSTEPTRENLAGGACYERFASVLLTLHSHEDRTGRIKESPGTVEDTYNRTLRIEKAGNSWGANTKLAYRFSRDSLTLHELGIVAKDKRKKEIWDAE